MGAFLKKYFLLISVVFVILLVLCAWKFPSAAPGIGIAFLCFSLGMAISSSVAKHRATYREGKLTRLAFSRNVSLDALGILLTVILAALLAQYVSGLVARQIAGELLRITAAILVGLLVGIGVGLLVNRIWARFVTRTN
jgi:hypothetical protein